jgi:hypothetical protein
VTCRASWRPPLITEILFQPQSPIDPAGGQRAHVFTAHLLRKGFLFGAGFSCQDGQSSRARPLCLDRQCSVLRLSLQLTKDS